MEKSNLCHKQKINKFIEDTYQQSIISDSIHVSVPNLQGALTKQDIDRLQFLYPHLTVDDYIKKLSFLYKNRNSIKNFNELENLCYLGLGKHLISVEKSQKNIQISRVNINLRAYMLPSVEQYIKELQSANPDVLYLVPDSKGLSYNPVLFPTKLDKENIYRPNEFFQIIREINHIIQKIIHKDILQGQNKNKKSWVNSFGLFFIVFMSIITPLLLINFHIQSQNISIICGLLLCILIIVIFIFGIHSYKDQIKQQWVIDKICKELRSYLEYINANSGNQIYTWKLGFDFYWIQIHKNYKQLQLQSQQNTTSKNLIIPMIHKSPKAKNSRPRHSLAFRILNITQTKSQEKIIQQISQASPP